MSFLGGPSWMSNPNEDKALGALSAGRDEMMNRKSAGNRYFRSILQGLMKGDTSAIGNPFLAQLAQQNEMVDKELDPLGNADQQRNLGHLQKARNTQNAGINFENYVRGQAATAAQGNLGFVSDKNRLGLGYDQAYADAALGSNQIVNKPGWGGMALGAGLGIASMFFPPAAAAGAATK